MLCRHYIAGEKGRLSKFLMCAIAVDAFLRLLSANVSIIIDVAYLARQCMLRNRDLLACLSYTAELTSVANRNVVLCCTSRREKGERGATLTVTPLPITYTKQIIVSSIRRYRLRRCVLPVESLIVCR